MRHVIDETRRQRSRVVQWPGALDVQCLQPIAGGAVENVDVGLAVDEQVALAVT